MARRVSGSVALVVREQYREVGLRVVGLGGQHAVHAVVAARLVHQAGAQVVQALARIAPLVEQGAALERGKAVDDEAHRLAAAVHLDGADGPRRGHGRAAYCAAAAAGLGVIEVQPVDAEGPVHAPQDGGGCGSGGCGSCAS